MKKKRFFSTCAVFTLAACCCAGCSGKDKDSEVLETETAEVQLSAEEESMAEALRGLGISDILGSSETESSASDETAQSEGTEETKAASVGEVLDVEGFASKYGITATADENKVILDTDLVYMNDDTLALLGLIQADNAGYVDLLGITTAGGNAIAAAVTYDTLSVLEQVGREDIPVCIGTDTPWAGFRNLSEESALIGDMGDMGAYSQLDSYVYSYTQAGDLAKTPFDEPEIAPSDQRAVSFLIEQVHEYPGQVTIIAAGACTNIAQAMVQDPSLASDAAGIIYTSGVFDIPGPQLPHSDFNWLYDPESINIVLHGDWASQTVIPYDAAVNTTMDTDVYSLYKALGTNDITSLIVDSESDESLDAQAALAVGVYLYPDLITTEETRDILVDTTYGHSYGTTYSWPEDNGPADSVSADIVFEIDQTPFWEFMSSLHSLKTD